MDDGINIRLNSEEVNNPRKRRLIGTLFVAVFLLLFVGGILLLIFLPYVLMTVFVVTLVVAMVLAAIAYPFDWVLKKLGRVGIIHTDGYGSFSFILGQGMFQKVSTETSEE